MNRRVAAICCLSVLLIVATFAAGVVAWRNWSAKDNSTPQTGPIATSTSSTDETASAAVETAEDIAVVEEFCSTCHVQPPPDCQPKSAWKSKIEWMYWWAEGHRPVPKEKIPPMEVPIRYYTSRAPDQLTLQEDALGSQPAPLPFQLRFVRLEAIPDPPSISNVKAIRLTDDGPQQLLVCDMRHGVMLLTTPARPEIPDVVIDQVAHPSHTQVIDLDGDGLRDILVANLGEFWPLDTTKGSVVWLRNRGAGQLEPVVLLDGLGRINDVQAADFDEDGDLDLVVAVFGNFTTGETVYLENFTEDYDEPDFEASALDYRKGNMYVPVTDLNGDGHLDFVAAFAQESECVVAFLNRGWGSFRQEMIYTAPHCLWGATGLRLVDLNEDGRVDVLHVNGDMVEYPGVLRPYHGVAWLENEGSYPFRYHRLTNFPGAHTVLPVDFDGDGKLDLVSSAFLPTFNPKAQIASVLDSVIWLRQTSTGEFRRYSLETGVPYHPCGDVMDIDEDGDLDIVLGNFVMYPEIYSLNACLTIVENRSDAPSAADGSQAP